MYVCVFSGERGRRLASLSTWRVSGREGSGWTKLGRGCCRCGRDRFSSWTESVQTWPQPSWQLTPPHSCWGRYCRIGVISSLVNAIYQEIGWCLIILSPVYIPFFLLIECFFNSEYLPVCLQAYSLCKSDYEKTSLLSDLLIRKGEGVTSTTRRVGPELSKRLFLLMNSCDPEQTLDSAVWPDIFLVSRCL